MAVFLRIRHSNVSAIGTNSQICGRIINARYAALYYITLAISFYSNEIEIGRTLSLKEGTEYGLQQIKKPNHFEKLTFYDVQLCFYKHRRFFHYMVLKMHFAQSALQTPLR